MTDEPTTPPPDGAKPVTSTAPPAQKQRSPAQLAHAERMKAMWAKEQPNKPAPTSSPAPGNAKASPPPQPRSRSPEDKAPASPEPVVSPPKAWFDGVGLGDVLGFTKKLGNIEFPSFGKKKGET
jgi:hypothetical protein